MSKASLKILIITESLDVNANSAAKGRLALINSFKLAGFYPEVYHYTQKEIRIDDVKCTPVFEEKFSAMYLLSRLHRLFFRWLKIDIGNITNILFGFSFGFFNDRNSVYKAIKKVDIEQYQMVWTFSQGSSFRSHAALLKLPKWHNKWYAYVHDPYPHHLYPRPYNFIEYGYKKKRYFFMDITKKAYKVVFPSLLLKEWMESYYIDVKEKSLILPHPLVTAKSSKDSLPEYFDSNKFNVLHAGNLLNLRDPLPLVEAYQKFLEIKPEAKNDSALLFIGKKSIFQDYLNKKRQYIPQLYISKDYEDFNKVFSMQQFTSVNVILEAKSEISPFLPGKFPHCVAANKPILLIGPHYSECKRLLGNDYSYLFDFDDIEKLTNSIVFLYDTWKQNSNNLTLNRPDLLHYLSADYSKEILISEL
ncbi:UDP-glycosyltransferase [uncultured Algibacter sp.]|uniref:UDP-glycosyltransferase n=1 Tax=uncultured Algibacter sp. TaxID=298659 RepID=UPI00262F2D3A|nr:UDP-glycosyltransferase [uncultured Algibacter sp.]